MLTRLIRRVLVRTERLPEIQERYEVVAAVPYGDITEVTYAIDDSPVTDSTGDRAMAPDRRDSSKPDPAS